MKVITHYALFCFDGDGGRRTFYCGLAYSRAGLTVHTFIHTSTNQSFHRIPTANLDLCVIIIIVSRYGPIRHTIRASALVNAQTQPATRASLKSGRSGETRTILLGPRTDGADGRHTENI